MSPHNLPFPPTAQTVKMLVLQFRVSCATNLDCSIQMVVKWVYQNPTQRMVEKSDFVCGSVLSKYEGTGSEKDQKLLNSIYIRENISCSGKIELPYYSIDNFPKICIYYEVKGTSRSLGTSLETYFKCEPWRFKREREKQWYKVTYRRRKRNEDILYIYQCYKLILWSKTIGLKKQNNLNIVLKILFSLSAFTLFTNNKQKIKNYFRIKHLHFWGVTGNT